MAGVDDLGNRARREARRTASSSTSSAATVLPSNLGGDRRGALGVDVGDDDLGAVTRQIARQCCADVTGALDQHAGALDALALIDVLDRGANRRRNADCGPRRGILVVAGDVRADVCHRLQVLDARAHVDAGQVGAAGADHELTEALHQRATVGIRRGRHDHRLRAAVGEPRERVLERHRRRQPLSLVIAAASLG